MFLHNAINNSNNDNDDNKYLLATYHMAVSSLRILSQWIHTTTTGDIYYCYPSS